MEDGLLPYLRVMGLPWHGVGFGEVESSTRLPSAVGVRAQRLRLAAIGVYRR